MAEHDEFQKLLDTLATKRDELIVTAHLAKLEAIDEWHELETKHTRLRANVTNFANTAEEAGRDVAKAARQLGEEIANGYEKLRKLF